VYNLVWLGLLSEGRRPKLLEPFKDAAATAPKEAVFQCSIDLGQPAAKVRCFREGRELTDGSKYSIVIRGDEIRLVVRDTELADQAKYRCEASNKTGHVDTEARLTMRSMSRILCIYKCFNHLSLEGENRAGLCWWGPGPTLRMDNQSGLIIHWSSGSHKRSTNLANQYDIIFRNSIV